MRHRGRENQDTPHRQGRRRRRTRILQGSELLVRAPQWIQTQLRSFHNHSSDPLEARSRKKKGVQSDVYYPFLCLVQWFSVISSTRLVVTAQKFLSVSLCAIFLSAIKLFTITTATQRILFGSSYAESTILPFRHSHRLGKPFSWPAPNSRLLSSENSVDLYWVGDIRGPPLEKNSILCALCISTATTFRS
jgi:hypothetical protein